MYLKDGSLISIDVGILSKDITEYIINLKKQFLNKIVISIIGYFKEYGFNTRDCTPWNREFLSFGDCIFYKVKNINEISQKKQNLCIFTFLSKKSKKSIDLLA